MSHPEARTFPGVIWRTPRQWLLLAAFALGPDSDRGLPAQVPGAAGAEVSARVVVAGDSAILILPGPAPLVSYQGEIRFDPSRVRITGAVFPAGVAGAANEVRPGQLRFAAASAAGVSAGPGLVLRLASGAGLTPRSFEVRMEEARVR